MAQIPNFPSFGGQGDNSPFGNIDPSKGNPIQPGGQLDPTSTNSPLNPNNPNSVYSNPEGKGKSSQPQQKQSQPESPISSGPQSGGKSPSSSATPAKAPTSQSSGGNPPSSGKPTSQSGGKAPPPPPNILKQAWQEKEKACVLVSGPPNNTIVQPMSKHRISWNQSPCQMSARVVGQFNVFLYNNLKMVPDEKSAKKRDYCGSFCKRDYTPNGKLIYDWGPRIIATNLTNSTNNYDWEVPYLNDPRITNSSAFYIRVETISYSGIFGATPPLGGTYGPVAIELRDPPPGFQEKKETSSAPLLKPSTLPSAAISLLGHGGGLLMLIMFIFSGVVILGRTR
ncbi:hypothetical protein G9A89_001041 [Geosiphon pyriformis]|nr:hypothetical protein G9A89_001041 [Geosiphon pyriformis]